MKFNTPIRLLSVIIMILFISCSSDSKRAKSAFEEMISFQIDEIGKKIDVNIDGKLFTSFQWSDNVAKPILYPIYSKMGNEITRGFPIEPREGERGDHPHQVGMWLTYGDVNGSDFWGNGSKGLGTINQNGGTIRNVKIEKTSESKGEGSIDMSAVWIDSMDQEILTERTEFHFIARDSIRIIDRITTLTANGQVIEMPDTKEGMFGIRVARQLELPSQGSVVLYNAAGELEKVDAATDESVSGDYLSSEGVKGLDVWSTRAKWMDLFGKIHDEEISVVICDHPDNLNYPTWWHARGYGLFAANPLGGKDFTDGEEVISFSLLPQESVTFKYRVILSSGFHLSEEEINQLSDKFNLEY